MSSLVKLSALLLAGMLAACGGEASAPSSYGLGRTVSKQELASWDIDVGPDGVGLPAGSATALSGEPIYLSKCAACHGEFGEGAGRFPALVGEPDSLVSERPGKNVGSYWAHATTLWDYINRAMPFGNAQSLSAVELYGITAYILALNDIIDEDAPMNARTLPKVQMPNRDGFILATSADIQADLCMKECVKEVVISSRASQSALSRTSEE